MCSAFAWFDLAWDLGMVLASLLALLTLFAISRQHEYFGDFLDLSITGSLILLLGVHGLSALSFWYPNIPPEWLAYSKLPLSILMLSTAISLSLWSPRVRSRLIHPFEVRGLIQSKFIENHNLRDRLHGEVLWKVNYLKALLVTHPQDQVIFASFFSKARTLPVHIRLYQSMRVLKQLEKNSWEGLMLGDIVRGQLTLFSLDKDAVIKGPHEDVLLTPRRAQYMSMALYELCLNAAQHAQKKGKGARFQIEWRYVPRGISDHHLEFYWQEQTQDVVLFPIYGAGQDVLSSESASFAFEGAKALWYLTPQTVRWHLSVLLEA